MNSKHKHGTTDTGTPGQARVAGPGEARSKIVRGNDRRRKANTGIEKVKTVPICEQLVAAREDAVQLREGEATSREGEATSREDAAHLREGNATSREHQIRATNKIHEAAEVHMAMLQQANERLVTATMESKQLSEQLQAAAIQLENSRSAAENANLAKSTFLSNMSHELRSPLNAILGFAQLLESGNPPPTAIQEVRLQQIIKAGWYLLELINEILDLALIESGKLSLSRESVLLNDVLLECEAMMAPMAQQRDIRIIFPRFDLACFVYGDRTRLKQVLINLLSNAIKYNREHGSVTLNYVMSTPGRIRLSITDTGKGLPPDKLAQLFQPFNRLGQEACGVEGTGIGLVVSRQLVELMGGEIGANSTLGVGSEFWIEMNRVEISHIDEKMTGPEKVVLQVTEKWQAHSLLYVEDNPTNLLLVEHIISDHPSLRMLSAHNGSLGVALARAHLPEVILMDISLPDMSGIEAMNILGKDPTTAHIPVIAVSANAMPRDIELGLEAGFFSYITKPINVNQLMNALDDALKSLDGRTGQ
jgi:signal transduction histidine kinase/ActR/RegA family two-component response regulator